MPTPSSDESASESERERVNEQPPTVAFSPSRTRSGKTRVATEAPAVVRKARQKDEGNKVDDFEFRDEDAATTMSIIVQWGVERIPLEVKVSE